ncbi:MAG: hypothetical protein GX774_10795 [Armatimonadetes bacterium]|nr:hypothetical protein [Armatimonadota bacterium]
MDTLRTLNDPELLRAREQHLERLRALFAGRPLAQPFFLQGVGAWPSVDPYTEPERWVKEALAELAAHAEAAKDPVVFRPLCLEFGPYGVHFIDRLFGAHVYTRAEQWWSQPLSTPVGALRPPALAGDETWALARRLAEAFVASGATVPFFGMPTIASALNVAVNLYGEDFLVALLTRPDAARHDLAVINRLLCDLHQWYRAHLPVAQLQAVVAAGRCQPPGHGQLCGCTTHLLSAEVYREFIAPLDDALLSVYPHGGMIHLCGVHTQHLPVWREMASLRAVQLNDRAAEDLEAYFRGLREDQVIYLNPTPTMTVARALAITGGRRLVLVAEPPAKTECG